jgi:hypothetical protein
MGVVEPKPGGCAGRATAAGRRYGEREQIEIDQVRY